jgi:hypothetical protein
MKVKMRRHITGYRNGVEWPLAGGVIDVPEDEARSLIAARHADALEEGDDAPTDPAEPAAVAPNGAGDPAVDPAAGDGDGGPAPGDGTAAAADGDGDPAPGEGTAAAADGGGDPAVDPAAGDGVVAAPASADPVKPRTARSRKPKG